MNPYLALAVQLVVVVALPGLVWLFRAALGSKLDELSKDTRTLAEAAADQRVHNATHEAQTQHIIRKVDELHDRVTSVEESQRRVQHRQNAIGKRLNVDFDAYDGY